MSDEVTEKEENNVNIKTERLRFIILLIAFIALSIATQKSSDKQDKKRAKIKAQKPAAVASVNNK